MNTWAQGLGNSSALGILLRGLISRRGFAEYACECVCMPFSPASDRMFSMPRLVQISFLDISWKVPDSVTRGRS